MYQKRKFLRKLISKLERLVLQQFYFSDNWKSYTCQLQEKKRTLVFILSTITRPLEERPVKVLVNIVRLLYGNKCHIVILLSTFIRPLEERPGKVQVDITKLIFSFNILLITTFQHQD